MMWIFSNSGIISEKSDDQLFVIETSGHGDGQASSDDKPRVLSKKERARNKVLYNDQALVPNPHIKEVSSRQGTGKRSRAVENANAGGISEAYQRPQPYKVWLGRMFFVVRNVPHACSEIGSCLDIQHLAHNELLLSIFGLVVGPFHIVHSLSLSGLHCTCS